MTTSMPLIFDGHNDILTKLFTAGGRAAVTRFADHPRWHLTAQKARSGGFGGGFFAIWVPSPLDMNKFHQQMSAKSYGLPLSIPVDRHAALDVAIAQAGLLHELQNAGYLEICVSTQAIQRCLNAGKLAAIMHMEGAEAIDREFAALDLFYAAGLRSLGPVWSRPNDFAEGVPFRFPASPDIGGGLTETGRRLIQYCNTKKILVDLSHLNEAGFWDVQKYSDAPLVATHSNAHAICPHARNLTDDQLRAIADSDGMVGVNFAVAFLREDGQMRADVSLDQVLRHMNYLIERLGENRVGFGSDFDGAMMPQDMPDATALNRMRAAMRQHGYNDNLMRKLCHENWLAVLERTWG